MVNDHIPALRFRWATKLYDIVMIIFMREGLLRSRTVDLLANKKARQVLEIGCGTASLTTALSSSMNDTMIYGADIDPEVLQIAAKKVSTRKNVKLVLANVLDADVLSSIADCPFDYSVSSLVFHHLTTERKANAFSNIHASMEVGGDFFLVDWGPPTGILQWFGFWFVRILDGFDVTEANYKGELPAMMASAGFQVFEKRPLHQTILGTVWVYSAKKL